MRRNGYFRAFDHESDPVICSDDLDFYKTGKFPQSDDFCGIYLTLMCTIFIWPCDRTFNPLTLPVIDELSFIHPTHKPLFLAAYVNPFLRYGWLNLIT